MNVCEEGGRWNVIGAVFSGGLGISDTNWVIYGGLAFASSAAYASPTDQMIVAENIEGWSGYVPDQYGCAGW